MSSSDWGRIRPTTVDINKLIKRNPKHRFCKMKIKPSDKNPLFIGLYCCEHNHWFTWINDEQEQYLIELGV